MMITYNINNIKQEYYNFNIIIQTGIAEDDIIKGKIYLFYLDDKISNLYPDKMNVTARFYENCIGFFGFEKFHYKHLKEFWRENVVFSNEYNVFYDDLLFHNNILYMFEKEDNKENIIRKIKINSLV